MALWLIKTVVCGGESKLERGKSTWKRCLELQGGCMDRLCCYMAKYQCRYGEKCRDKTCKGTGA